MAKIFEFKNDLRYKLGLSFLVLVVGFGYFFSFIYATIYILQNPNVSNLWIIVSWALYIFFFSFPAKLAWAGFYNLFQIKVNLIGKWILMFVFYVIWPLYFLFSFLEIWYFGPKNALIKESQKIMKKEQETFVLPIRRIFTDENILFWTRDEWISYSTLKKLVGGFHYFSAIKIHDPRSDFSLTFKTPKQLESKAFPFYYGSDETKTFDYVFKGESIILDNEFPFYPYEPFIDYVFKNVNFNWKEPFTKDEIIEINFFKEIFIYQD